MNKGYIHIYTGNGKGKTTAALGLSVRAVCAGKKVFFGQFIKGMEYSELKVEDMLPNIKFKQFGRDCFIKKAPDEEDIRIANEGLKYVEEVLKSDDYDLVILDEIIIAIYFKLFSDEEVIDIIKNRNPEIEVILTGRYASDQLISMADLVTEMKEIKHYYDDQGVQARLGIEK